MSVSDFSSNNYRVFLWLAATGGVLLWSGVAGLNPVQNLFSNPKVYRAVHVILPSAPAKAMLGSPVSLWSPI